MQKRLLFTYGQMACLSVLFILFYFHTLSALVQDWSDNPNFSHGFLVPLISLFMIWQKKDELTDKEINPSNMGIVFVLIGLCLHIVGNIGAEFFTMRFSIIITLFGIILFILGKQICWTILIPIIYLIFMIPIPAIIWNKIAFPLQLFAARITSDVLHMLNITVLREGNVLILSNTTLEVVDACSGLRSLTSLLALSAAFAYLSDLKLINKLFLFLISIPIAVCVNIIRLSVTAISAKMIGPEFAEGFLHEMSGILVFVVALALLYLSYILFTKIESIISKVYIK